LVSFEVKKTKFYNSPFFRSHHFVFSRANEKTKERQKKYLKKMKIRPEIRLTLVDYFFKSRFPCPKR
jgi:hypothetical protein